MTHQDDARFDDLLAHLGDGDSKDLFRTLLQRGMQELIDAELTATIGAELHERTDTRINQRNGGRSRTLSTPAGDIELRIPKLRVGSFFPSLLEPRRRVDQALWAVIMTAYITGTSTRKVDDGTYAIGEALDNAHRVGRSVGLSVRCRACSKKRRVRTRSRLSWSTSLSHSRRRDPKSPIHQIPRLGRARSRRAAVRAPRALR